VAALIISGLLLSFFVRTTVGMTHATTAASALKPPRVGPVSSNLGTLRRAGARGTLLAIDPTTRTASFRITCGRRVPSKAKITPGVYRLGLRGAEFGWAVGYNGRGGGHVVELSWTKWLAAAKRYGWSGYIYIRPPNAPRSVWLTNGGGTDVCAGVFG
jgi:hypothetical protein